MNSALTVRSASSDDLDRLLDLYTHLTPNNIRYPQEIADKILASFLKYEGSALLLGEINDELVASCALVVIPNLTRSGTPYALIENVVTHAGHRCKGYGKLLLGAATDRAWEHGCYKVMLMTGSHESATLAFYESAGFQQSKTGFQKRRPINSKPQ